MQDSPVISIIVTFRDSEPCVLDCLASIDRLDYPPDRLEVLAVCDSPEMETAGLVREQFPHDRLLHNRTPLGCDGAKQAGMDSASGDVIALTDADCTVSPSWAKTIAKHIINGSDAVTGPVRHPKTLRRELVAIADFPDSQWEEHRLTNAFPGCNFAVRRGLLHGTGFRSYGIKDGSDRLLSWQLFTNGYTITYDPGMTVEHFPRVGISSLLERRMRYARTAIIMRRIDPSLPGGSLVRMGSLAAPIYFAFKAFKDTSVLLRMSGRGLVNPLHVPLLLPSLLLLRLMDSVGILLAGRQGNSPHPRRIIP